MGQCVGGPIQGPRHQLGQLPAQGNLGGAAHAGQLRFEQEGQRRRVAQPATHAAQRGLGVAVVRAVGEGMAIGVGSRGVVAASHPGIADPHLPLAAFHRQVGGLGRPLRDVDELRIAPLALEQVRERLRHQADRFLALGGDRERLDGRVGVVERARLERGDPQPQGDLGPRVLGGVGQPALEQVDQLGVALGALEPFGEVGDRRPRARVEPEHGAVVPLGGVGVGEAVGAECGEPAVERPRALGLGLGLELGA